jgi:uncharacterized RDD family membrane protein YckC
VADEQPPLDTRIEIITPENIAFQYRLAGPFRRLPAYLLDLLFRLLACAVLAAGVSFMFGLVNLNGLGSGLLLVSWFVFTWFYGGLFETFWNGQTPGKRILRLRVLTVEGQPIQAWQAILRNFLRSVDALPSFMYQVGFLCAAMNDRFQRLGDLACGTMVVVEEPQRNLGIMQMQEPAAVYLAEQLPPNFQVSRSLGRALAAYVARRPRFAWRRQLEVAEHLATPLRHKLGLPPETNADVLLCALYRRAFLAAEQPSPTADAASPPLLLPAALS